MSSFWSLIWNLHNSCLLLHVAWIIAIIFTLTLTVIRSYSSIRHFHSFCMDITRFGLLSVPFYIDDFHHSYLPCNVFWYKHFYSFRMETVHVHSLRLVSPAFVLRKCLNCFIFFAGNNIVFEFQHHLHASMSKSHSCLNIPFLMRILASMHSFDID